MIQIHNIQYSNFKVSTKIKQESTLKCSYAKSRRQAPTTPLGILSRLTYETETLIIETVSICISN